MLLSLQAAHHVAGALGGHARAGAGGAGAAAGRRLSVAQPVPSSPAPQSDRVAVVSFQEPEHQTQYQGLQMGTGRVGLNPMWFPFT